MSFAVVSRAATHLLDGLAISLTPGLGPTKARTCRTLRVPEAVFRSSLTELEGTGIEAAPAQSLATGKSTELAREEVAQAAAAGIALLSMILSVRRAPTRLTIPRYSFGFAAIQRY